MAWACPGLASVSQGHSGSVEFLRSDDVKRPDMQHGAVRGNGCQLCAHAAARASLTVQKARWPGLVPGLASVSGRNVLPEAHFFSISARQPPRDRSLQALTHRWLQCSLGLRLRVKVMELCSLLTQVLELHVGPHG